MTTNITTRRVAKPRASGFAKNLLEEWRRLNLPRSEENIVVAVSGGADSTALFLGLNELVRNGYLDLKLIVGHLDHGLRKLSRQDAQWVSKLGKGLGYDVVIARRNLKPSVPKPGTNVEQTARKARYDFLLQTAQKTGSRYVLTAHTLDDQAETVLLRLLRGSAAEGLSGASAVRSLAANSDVQLVRPLLSWARRGDTENYCRVLRIDFRVDEMNEDEKFSRVRVRKHLLPLMKSFNNRIVEALGRTASLLNEDAAALGAEAKRLLESAAQKSNNNETKLPLLNVDLLLQAPFAVRRRVLREWILRERGDLRRLEMIHLLAVEKLLDGQGGRVAELPGGMKVTRKGRMLELSGKKRLKKTRATPKIPAR
jgi:tRNA(Ile)-lysidine synthase